MAFIVIVGILTVLSTYVQVIDARVRAPERPVVPNVTATSPTEIKMSWCRVKPNNIEIDHYELFIDNELEYSGIDVMYVAKRLKPWSWYEVKLRACGFQPGFACSPFSRPILVKTLSSGENDTTIESTASVFKKVVLPTYMFIAGVLVGVVTLAMALIWRYLQSNDTWMNEPAFELPKHVQQQSQLCLKGKLANLNMFLTNNTTAGTKKTQEVSSNLTQVKDEESCHHVLATENGMSVDDMKRETPVNIVNSSNQPTGESVEKQEISVQTVDSCLLLNDLENGDASVPEKNQPFSLPWCQTHADLQESQPPNIPYSDHDVLAVNQFPVCNWQTEQGHLLCHNFQTAPNHQELQLPIQSANEFNYNLDGNAAPESCIDDNSIAGVQYNDDTQDITIATNEFDDQSKGVVIVVDNSNIYIGAQECASANNTAYKKRHVRVKLQNLVKILEKNRPKERTFVCGSSPPATEHVWDVYRHLGYVVDLEERRGKDEQRVDEGLHLFIYKAICELSPRVLVLASGDGMKGKSENSTSFPGCATMALEKGWTVEVYSWKHSLSTEWLKLAKKYPEHLTIHYLDKYVNNITFVDGKNGRKCLPVDDNHGKERSRMIHG